MSTIPRHEPESMPILRPAAWCVLALSAASCAEPISPWAEVLTHAVATSACGPTDGPAIAIYLSHAPVQPPPPSAPYLRMNIWHPLEGLAVRSWSLVGSQVDGAAVYHSTASEHEFATRGKVSITRVESDSTIHGIADVTFPGAGRIRRHFEAVWFTQAQLCG